MKKTGWVQNTLLILSFFGLMALTMNANASVIKVETSINKWISTDSERIISGGAGLEVALHAGRFFIAGSQDTFGMRWMGQSSPDLTIRAIKLGITHGLGKHLRLSLAAGWFQPSFKGMDEPQAYYSSPFAEGLCRYLNDYLIPGNGDQESYPAWDWYSLKYQGALGAELSLNFEYQFTDSFGFSIITGYRYLKMNETIKGHDWSDGTDWEATNYWVIIREKDMSAYKMGVTFEYKF